MGSVGFTKTSHAMTEPGFRNEETQNKIQYAKISKPITGSTSKFSEWAHVLKFMLGVFGCKEVGGSKKMRKYNYSLPYQSKHRKRKMRKLLSLFSFPFYTITSALSGCYS